MTIKLLTVQKTSIVINTTRTNSVEKFLGKARYKDLEFIVGNEAALLVSGQFKYRA